MVGHSTDFKYKDMVSNKLLPNSPIASHDITNENYIFEPDLNTSIDKPSKVGMEEYVNIPEDFYKLHNFVTLTSAVMFVNGNIFIITS